MSMVPANEGDSLSKLVQLQASRNGVRLRWSGNGHQDLLALCLDTSNKTMLSQCLWNGMKELLEMPELKELPDPIQAKIYAIVLQARALFEIELEKRNEKQAQASMKPGPGASA